MNRKGVDMVMDNFVFIFLFIIFIIVFGGFIYLQSNGAYLWERYYTIELKKVIDLSRPGDIVSLDAQKGTQIAKRNGINSEEVFLFNNTKKEICVKFSKSNPTCLLYANNVNIAKNGDKFIYLASPVNILKFKVEESP